MRQLVLSLARLYQSFKITEEKLAELLKANKITKEEYNYIISTK